MLPQPKTRNKEMYFYIQNSGCNSTSSDEHLVLKTQQNHTALKIAELDNYYILEQSFSYIYETWVSQ